LTVMARSRVCGWMPAASMMLPALPCTCACSSSSSESPLPACARSTVSFLSTIAVPACSDAAPVSLPAAAAFCRLAAALASSVSSIADSSELSDASKSSVERLRTGPLEGFDELASDTDTSGPGYQGEQHHKSGELQGTGLDCWSHEEEVPETDRSGVSVSSSSSEPSMSSPADTTSSSSSACPSIKRDSQHERSHTSHQQHLLAYRSRPPQSPPGWCPRRCR